MGIVIAPLEGTTFGAEVTGVDLTDLDDRTWGRVEAAFHEYGILIFHDQHFTRDSQIAFGQRFGPLEINDTGGLRPDVDGKPLVLDISNVDEHGVHQADPAHPINRFNTGNEGWHSDSSFREVTAKASILFAIEVPTSGGDTGFADMRAAYDVLPEDLKADLATRQAYHSLKYSQAVSRSVDMEVPERPTDVTGAWHPVVRTHPATGRRSLFVGRHACQLSGMPVVEGQQLLAELLDGATQPPRIHHHHWSPGDVVIWDNRCIDHQATSYDFGERRVLRHVRVAGEPEPAEPVEAHVGA
ncbi:MAG: TauD/TfdA dioxygenase family protein [Acidimicrobiia bacterium]